MNHDDERFHELPVDELPDGLGEIVARLVAEPAPDELKEQVRSGLVQRLEQHQRPTRVKKYAAVAAAIAAVAAIVAATIFLPFSSRPSVVTPEVIDVVSVPPAKDPTTAAKETTTQHEPHAGPSLWTYHRASHDSIDRIDVLLGQHAAMALSADRVNRHADRLTTSQFFEEI